MAQTAFTIGVSQQWLDYSFDRVRGMTPAEALRSYRMNRLFVLLSRQPEQSLDCAIEACGLTGTPRVDALFENTFGIEMPMFLLTCRRAAGDRQEHRTTCLEVGQ